MQREASKSIKNQPAGPPSFLTCESARSCVSWWQWRDGHLASPAGEDARRSTKIHNFMEVL
jgi:hypothetical protein